VDITQDNINKEETEEEKQKRLEEEERKNTDATEQMKGYMRL